MNTAVKEPTQYFGGVDAEGYAEGVAGDAERVAHAALRRRRPDLTARAARSAELPDDERAQFDLDRMAFIANVADRLMAEVNGIVFDARHHGASWARIGTAINESPQTAFNRYRKLDVRAQSPQPGRQRRKRDPET